LILAFLSFRSAAEESAVALALAVACLFSFRSAAKESAVAFAVAYFLGRHSAAKAHLVRKARRMRGFSYE
jgi:hypothetical protein